MKDPWVDKGSTSLTLFGYDSFPMSVPMPRSVAVTLATLTTVVCLSGSANGENRTTATIFQAFSPHGLIKLNTRSKAGFCWEGAVTILRRDAWRCSVPGNHISYVYDLCFSSRHDSGIVVCPDAPWRKTGVTIRLTKPLPRARANHSAPSLRLQPWAIELYNGRLCQFVSGATDLAEGMRLNYLCRSGSEGLWGFPNRGSEPWTIVTALPRASKLSTRLAVRHAWM